MISHAPNIGSV
jgi:hypothetical protein